MKIGDLFANSATPDFAEKGAFDTKRFKANGGDTSKPPYSDVTWDRDEYRQPCKVKRVFISADWYPDWASWKKQADAALTAAIGGESPYFGSTVRSAEGYRIIGEPHYLLDEADIFGKPESRVWINCLCPNEAEFVATVSEARALIAERERVIARDGRAGLTAALSAEAPHYNPQDNATGGTLADTFF